MLLDFTVTNYECFAHTEGVDFMINSPRDAPGPGDNWSDITGRVAALFGANGSGKAPAPGTCDDHRHHVP